MKSFLWKAFWRTPDLLVLASLALAAGGFGWVAFFREYHPHVSRYEAAAGFVLFSAMSAFWFYEDNKRR